MAKTLDYNIVRDGEISFLDTHFGQKFSALKTAQVNEEILSEISKLRPLKCYCSVLIGAKMSCF